MYKKILSAVNESLNSEIAARYALNLAKTCNAKLYLCFVAEKGIKPEVFRRAEEAMQRLFLEAEEMDIRVESITEEGDPVKRISDLVKKEGIDLVMAATRKEDMEKRFYVKTVSRRLALSLPCSVAVIKVTHTGRIHPKKILVPMRAAMGYIEERAYFTTRLAKAFDADVVVFYNPKPMTKFFHGEIHLTPVEWEARIPEDISHFMEHLDKHRIVHGGKIVPGKAGRAITIEAAAKRHDLIIMGASERSLLSSFIKGNPVEDVFRNTPCDLIILKPRHANP
ncbi:MAG: universal stress protein [Nitrospirae bacterium]|nr:universal stress protein [Nitrospirota bacterium]